MWAFRKNLISGESVLILTVSSTYESPVISNQYDKGPSKYYCCALAEVVYHRRNNVDLISSVLLTPARRRSFDRTFRDFGESRVNIIIGSAKQSLLPHERRIKIPHMFIFLQSGPHEHVIRWTSGVRSLNIGDFEMLCSEFSYVVRSVNLLPFSADMQRFFFFLFLGPHSREVL